VAFLYELKPVKPQLVQHLRCLYELCCLCGLRPFLRHHSSHAAESGIVERFFRSLKEDCVWQHNFGEFGEARTAITNWIHWYKRRAPHQALGYRSLRQLLGLQPKLVV
jgi:transposase InsO family protein